MYQVHCILQDQKPFKNGHDYDIDHLIRVVKHWKNKRNIQKDTRNIPENDRIP